jgi:CubicO group peptidase (beta-lactamase class C family)
MLIEPRLSKVAERFFQQVDAQPYGGAALAIYQDGEMILDIWAGESRPGTSWEADTTSVIFSATKGALTILVLRAIERGELDINQPVAHYWPEFAAGGKSAITVKMVLRHRAGLNTTGRDMTLQEILDLLPVEEMFASQEPIYQPDSGFVYHALSVGHLLGKILFNITGKRINQLLQEEIAHPLRIPMWIGVPENHSLDIAQLKSDQPDHMPAFEHGSKEYWQAHAMGYGFSQGKLEDEIGGWNDPRLHRAEIAGAGGVTDARSIAKMYSAAVTETDGVRILSDEMIHFSISHPNPGDNIFGEPQPHPIHSLGFIVANNQHCPAISNTTFGHNGFGGQQGFGDLDSRIGFGYVTNWVPAIADGMLRHRELTKILIESL